MAMGDTTTIDNIDLERFNTLLAQYPDVVPEKLASSPLEEQRLKIIPSAIEQRKQDGKAYLTKDELVTLVDWKLSHGTFRPSLQKLVKQNSDADVEETTARGFAAKGPPEALKILTRLKGVGPATASLLLSVHDRKSIPFFSDELFRWCFWEDKTGNRWDRKIKYNAKEYEQLITKVTEFRDRMKDAYTEDVAALDIEKVAYFLGRSRTDITASVGTDSKPEPNGAESNKKRKAPLEDVDASLQDKDAPSTQKKKKASTAGKTANDTSIVEKPNLRRSGRTRPT